MEGLIARLSPRDRRAARVRVVDCVHDTVAVSNQLISSLYIGRIDLERNDGIQNSFRNYKNKTRSSVMVRKNTKIIQYRLIVDRTNQ